MMNVEHKQKSVEERTIGDSRGYLWKITIDKQQAMGRVEKISGLRDSVNSMCVSIDGIEYRLPPDSSLRDDMQYLTAIIESRFQAA